MSLVAVLALAGLNGCVAENVYDNVGKPMYNVGKAVVVLNADLISEEKMEELKKIDNALIRVDTTKELVKQLETKEDANSSKSTEESISTVGGK